MNSTLFDTLGGLKKALEDNDVAGIQQAMTGLDSASITLIINWRRGGPANRLETRQSILQNMTLNFTEQLSQVEDADVAECPLN